MTARQKFLPAPEPGPDVNKIEPIENRYSQTFFRPEGSDLWFDFDEYTPGDENDLWSGGVDWAELRSEFPEGFIEAEKTAADIALAYFRENPELGNRPTKEAREHAQALISAALEKGA